MNDLFYTALSNLNSTITDLRDIGGLTYENTVLGDKSTYLEDEEVLQKFLTADGKFNLKEFDAFYEAAAKVYEYMSTLDYINKLMDDFEATFDKYNIYEQNKTPNEAYLDIIRVSNPNRLLIGTINLGRTLPLRFSIDEIALSLKYLKNPIEYAKGAEAEWGEAPGKGLKSSDFWKDFFKTKVLALWEEDGTHIDPISGEEIQHIKGEYKLNDEGTYYYEDLEGRSVYDKLVLNKLNILTEEGTKINKYDFFDSDDLNQKGVGKTLLKNAALVGSLYIPYVGPVLAGLGVLTQTAGMLATLGKMAVDSEFLNEVEGYAKSTNRQYAKSLYALENTWCWENFINLIGDVSGLLAELRFLFNYFPAIFKGTSGITKEGREALESEYAKELEKASKETIENLTKKIKNGDIDSLNRLLELSNLNAFKARTAAEKYIKEYDKIGNLARSVYMTGITVGDTYGEAINAGASKGEAALLTMGYAAAEYALLLTGLGEMILPELRADKFKNKAIVNALVDLGEDAKNLNSTVDKEVKKNLTKKIFNKGKEIAKDVWTSAKVDGSRSLKATVAAALGEGTEEVSEELLLDFSYTCHNLVQWLQGDVNTFGEAMRGEGTGLQAFSNMRDRYLMSFVGGAVGGGLTNAVTNFKMSKSIGPMTSELALLELIYMCRNDEIDGFLKSVDKMTIMNKNFSTLLDESTGTWKKGTKEDNQDLAAKTAIHEQVRIILDILNSNGLTLSDDSLIAGLTDLIKDLKLSALMNTSTAGGFLLKINSLTSEIVKLELDSRNIKTDREKREEKEGEASEKPADTSKIKLKELIKLKDDLLSGKYKGDFIRDILVELSPALSHAKFTFHQFAETRSNKAFKDISKEELAKLSLEYTTYLSTSAKDDIHQFAAELEDLMHRVSDTYKNQTDAYKKLLTDTRFRQLLDLINNLNLIINNSDPETLLTEVSESKNQLWLKLFTYLAQYNGDTSLYDKFISDSKAINDLLTSIVDKEDDTEETKVLNTAKREELFKQEEALMSAYKKDSYIKAVNNVLDLVQPILDMGFATTELKEQIISLLSYLTDSANPLSQALVEIQEENAGNYSEWFPGLTESDLFTKIDKINDDLIKRVQELKTSPIEDMLNSLSVEISGDPITVLEVLSKIDSIIENSTNIGDLGSIKMESDLESAIDETIRVVDLLKLLIEGLRVDNGNINNLYGFSNILNLANKEKEGYKELAEIDGNIAEALIQDLDSIKNKLIWIKTLNSINLGIKLRTQDKIAVHYNYTIYNTLRNWLSVIITLPDDWEGKDLLLVAFDKMSFLKLHSNDKTFILNEELRVLVEQELLDFEDALFTFFKNNKALLENSEKVALLLQVDTLYTRSDSVLTDKDEKLDGTESRVLDGNAFVWYLASRAALKSSNFYYLYNEYLKAEENNVAPISAQEAAIYMLYSFSINGGVFKVFADAAISKLKNDWKNRTADLRKEIFEKLGIKNASLFSDNYELSILALPCMPQFSSIALVEGIPGAGKTNAVMLQLKGMLAKYYPDKVAKAAVINTSNTTADRLANNILKLENSTLYSHLLFLLTIIAGYTPDTRVDNRIAVTHWKVEEGLLNTTWELNAAAPIPSIIFIDEVSRYSSFELRAIDNFAKAHGILVITAGDFDLSGFLGTVLLPEGTTSLTHSRNEFIRCPKLGTSFRTANLAITQSLNKLRAFMLSPNEYFPTLNYYLDEQIPLLGVKVYSNLNLSGINLDDPDEDGILILDTINKLVGSLQNGELIFYIYDLQDELYTELSKDIYKDKIVLCEGSSALGLECKYTIVNLHPSTYNFSDASTKENYTEGLYLLELYTAVSRSEEGCLLIANLINGQYKFPFVPTSAKDISSLIESIGDVSKYKERRIGILDKLTFNTEEISIVTVQNNPPKKVYIPPIITLRDNYEKDKDETKKDIDLANGADNLNPIKNIATGDFDALLFSFNTFENGGFMEGTNGEILPNEKVKEALGDEFDARIDSLHGILKVNPSVKYKDGMKLLGQLRSVLLTFADKNNIVARISRLLGTSLSVSVEFGFKGTTDSIVEYDEKYSGFRLDYLNENLEYLYPSDDRTLEVNRHKLIATISLDGIKTIEVPLLTLNNPVSIISQLVNGKIVPMYESLYKTWKRAIKNKSFHEAVAEFLSTYERDYLTWKKADKNKARIYELFKLFSNGQRFYYSISNRDGYSDWTPGKDLESYGPCISEDRGATYEVNGFGFSRRWISLSQFTLNPSLKVSNVLFDANATSKEGGIAFVLVSDNVFFDSDDAMVEYYLNLERDSSIKKLVKKVYVAPPTATIEEYLDNLDNVILKKETEKFIIGNDFTSYHLASEIIKDTKIQKIINLGLAKDATERSSDERVLIAMQKLVLYLDSLHDSLSKDGSKDVLSEMLKLLTSPLTIVDKDEIKFVESSYTTSKLLAGLIHAYCYPRKFGSLSDQAIPVKDSIKVKLILDILEKSNISSIRYFMKSQKSPTGIVLVGNAYATVGGYTMNTMSGILEFEIHGKLDSTVFRGGSRIFDLISDWAWDSKSDLYWYLGLIKTDPKVNQIYRKYPLLRSLKVDDLDTLISLVNLSAEINYVILKSADGEIYIMEDNPIFNEKSITLIDLTNDGWNISLVDSEGNSSNVSITKSEDGSIYANPTVNISNSTISNEDITDKLLLLFNSGAILSTVGGDIIKNPEEVLRDIFCWGDETEPIIKLPLEADDRSTFATYTINIEEKTSTLDEWIDELVPNTLENISSCKLNFTAFMI